VGVAQCTGIRYDQITSIAFRWRVAVGPKVPTRRARQRRRIGHKHCLAACVSISFSPHTL
jgi:hypothetical protein